MKKVFNSLILAISFPVRLLKKSKIDNFVGGLIFGALFSLLVNVVTVHIQETVQRQHILEAIENEITNNTLKAKYISEQIHEKNEPYNFLSPTQRYSISLWEQSSETLQYISQLDQGTQITLTGYYTTTIPLNNGALDKLEKLTDDKLLGCDNLDSGLSKDKAEKCITWNGVKLELEKSIAQEVFIQGFEVMKVFHPTQDRLNNWFLRILMGTKSTRVLSGE